MDFLDQFKMMNISMAKTSIKSIILTKMTFHLIWRISSITHSLKNKLKPINGILLDRNKLSHWCLVEISKTKKLLMIIWISKINPMIMRLKINQSNGLIWKLPRLNFSTLAEAKGLTKDMLSPQNCEVVITIEHYIYNIL